MQPVTFLEALRYAQQRKILLPNEFYSLDLKTRQMATTVSFLSSLEQIETVINAANKAIADGGTFKDFQKLIKESDIILPKHYLDNVFRTNIQSAYGHGVLMPMGLSFEVVSIEALNGKMIYTLKALVN